MLILKLGLNAESNQVMKIVQNSNKTVKLQTSLAYEEQMSDPIERSLVLEVYLDFP